MLGSERLAACQFGLIIRFREGPGEGPEARKVLCFKLDNKSIQSERDNALIKSDGTKLECL